MVRKAKEHFHNLLPPNKVMQPTQKAARLISAVMRTGIMELTLLILCGFILCGCRDSSTISERGAAPRVLVVPGTPDAGPKEWPSAKDTTAALIKYLSGPPPDDLVGSTQARATAIDLLAERRSVEAIPCLIECVGDTRGLIGSDNWVGGHAVNALQAITGEALGYEKEKWQNWWKENKQEFLQAHEGNS